MHVTPTTGSPHGNAAVPFSTHCVLWYVHHGSSRVATYAPSHWIELLSAHFEPTKSQISPSPKKSNVCISTKQAIDIPRICGWFMDE